MMKQKTRKLIGIFATVGFLTLYSLAAMAIGGDVAVGRSSLVEVGYYFLAGIAWVPPVMGIIRWMSRPDKV